MTTALHMRLACLPCFWWAASWSSFCSPYGSIVLVMCYNAPPQSVPQALLLEDKLLVSLFFSVRAPGGRPTAWGTCCTPSWGALSAWHPPSPKTPQPLTQRAQSWHEKREEKKRCKEIMQSPKGCWKGKPLCLSTQCWDCNIPACETECTCTITLHSDYQNFSLKMSACSWSEIHINKDKPVFRFPNFIIT